jgi:putative FmdB family regulatory protein
MPIYSYVCEKCKNSFELLEGVTSEKTQKECPKCGSSRIRRTIASFSMGSSSGGSDLASGGSCPTGTCPLP